jgi:hypothetical protein
LLGKRDDLLTEAERVSEQLAKLTNDIDALDRALAILGYVEDLKDRAGRRKRDVVFGRRGLSKVILGELRNATSPVTNRGIAFAIISKRGEDPKDRTRLANVMKMTAKALQKLRVEGVMKVEVDEKKTMRWERRTQSVCHLQSIATYAIVIKTIAGRRAFCGRVFSQQTMGCYGLWNRVSDPRCAIRI